MTVRAVMVPAQSNPYGELLAEALRAQGVEVVLGDGPRRFPVLPLVFAWLRAGRPEVLHLHWTHRYLARRPLGRAVARVRTSLELRLLRRVGVRIVWTIHNVGVHDGRRDDEERLAHAAIAATSDAIICHCDAARRLAADAFGLDAATKARMHVIAHGNYAGVYPDTFGREMAREALGLASGDLVFLFLGRIRRYKGVEDLIDAFGAIRRDDLRLVVAGRLDQPGLRRSLQLRADQDPRVMLVPGQVPDDRMQVFLRAADVLVLPYRDVLTSGSAILGMTFGLPVIAPRIGCLPETLEGCSILYDADQPSGLPDALGQAIAADLRALGERAAAAAAELSWGPIGARTAALYRGDPVD